MERKARVLAMLEAHEREGFGNCTNEGECEAVCPKSIRLSNASVSFGNYSACVVRDDDRIHPRSHRTLLIFRWRPG